MKGLKMNTPRERAAKFEAVLTAGGVNVRRVKSLGAFVHIDTFETHAETINAVMDGLGFKRHSVSNGVHLDGVDGFRMVFCA